MTKHVSIFLRVSFHLYVLYIPLTGKSNAQGLKSEAHLQDSYHNSSCPLPRRELKKLDEKKISTSSYIRK